MQPSGKTSVVFFGTGPVAARCLQLLCKHFTIEAVVTKPRPAHHKYESPVLQVAEAQQFPVLYAANKSQLDAVLAQQAFTSQLGVLIDFGIIISQAAISTFPRGIINSHFSLLPRWRGADPITFAITSGDTKTGVSLMMIDEGMDTGKLLTYRTLHMAPGETAITLTDKLIVLSDELLQEFIPKYLNGQVQPKNQPHPSRATYSRKLTKQDGIIDWQLSAAQIERNIRGYIEWPGSRTTLGATEVIITAARVVDQTGTPGTYRIDGKQLIIFAGTGALAIDSLKPIGKKDMPTAAFLAGYSKNLQ